MNWIDFIIGLTFLNGLPHFVLGVWKGKMLSAFGFGNKQNILYGLINLTISITMFLSTYGIDGLLNNSMYLGGLFVIVAYLALGPALYKKFNK